MPSHFTLQKPYIYRIESNTGKLLYFGSRHSFDPDDPQMDTLTHKFKQFDPDIVITEAFPEKFDFSLNKQEGIKTSGEFGLTWKMAENRIFQYNQSSLHGKRK